MYGGRLVEDGSDRSDLFEKPLHPYTHGLLAQRPDPAFRGHVVRDFDSIPGQPPDLAELCRRAAAFAPRCRHVKTDLCRGKEEPALRLAHPTGERAPAPQRVAWRSSRLTGLRESTLRLR